MKNNDKIEYIKNKARTTNRRDSNCIGTAFYLVGEQDKDVALGREKALEIISGLEDCGFPEQGNIVYWKYNNYFIHAGVVFDKEKMTMIHRREKKGLLELCSIEELNKYFGQAKYKIPRRFS